MSMENKGDRIAPRLRISGALISMGLLIEVFTLSWNNPVAFLVFLGIGGLFLAVGIIFYLLSLVSPSSS